MLKLRAKHNKILNRTYLEPFYQMSPNLTSKNSPLFLTVTNSLFYNSRVSFSYFLSKIICWANIMTMYLLKHWKNMIDNSPFWKVSLFYFLTFFGSPFTICHRDFWIFILRGYMHFHILLILSTSNQGSFPNCCSVFLIIIHNGQ